MSAPSYEDRQQAAAALLKEHELKALRAAITLMQMVYRDECSAAERPGMTKAIACLTDLIKVRA